MLMDHFPEEIVMMNPLTLLPQGLLQYGSKIHEYAAAIAKPKPESDTV